MTGDGVFTAIDGSGHEVVLFGHDKVTGLRAVIAVHSTVLGPALGGTRFYPYVSETAALADVLRLSRAMSYKAAAAGLDLGGGKAVILGDPAQDKSEQLLRAYGRLVDSLGGRYITAEDVGTTVADLEMVHRETTHVAGLPVEAGGSGDPSPATAAGVAAAMRAAAGHLWADPDLAGRRITIVGVGKVGAALAGILAEAGCEVVVADVDARAVDAVTQRWGVKSVDVREAPFVDCDILAPCALGAVLNRDTVPGLRCRAVVGAANNQLEQPDDAARLQARGIVYAPDFVVNAGGLINISEELHGYCPDRAASRVQRILETTLAVLDAARSADRDTHSTAMGLAEARIRSLGELDYLRTGPGGATGWPTVLTRQASR